MPSFNKNPMLKMTLISLTPILAFIFVEQYWGPKAGIIAGITLGFTETLFLYLTEKRLDKLSIGSTLLILIMGSVSLFSSNQIFFKLNFAIMNMIIVFLLVVSNLMKKPIILLFIKKQFGENFSPNKGMIEYFSGLSWRISLLLTFHAFLIIYAALFWSNTVWGFITKGGSFILMGIFLVAEFIYSKLIMPKKLLKKKRLEQEIKINELIEKRKKNLARGVNL